MANEIRSHPNPFAQSAITRAIEKANLVNGERVAFVAFADKKLNKPTEIGLAVYVKIDDHWSFGGILTHNVSGISGEAQVRFAR